MISMWWMSAYWLYGGHLYSPYLQCYCLSREPHVHQNSSLSTCLKAEENYSLHLLKTFRCVFDEHANFSTCMISRFYFRVAKRYSAHLYSLEIQELFALPKHLCSPSNISGARFAWSFIVFCVNVNVDIEFSTHNVFL